MLNIQLEMCNSITTNERIVKISSSSWKTGNFTQKIATKNSDQQQIKPRRK